MVDQLGFSRLIGGFGQPFLPGKHIDKRTFTHITAADKGKFGAVGLRALGYIWLADDVFRFQDIHIRKCNVQIFSLQIMRVVIQRASQASVTIDARVNGSIGNGLLVLVGIEDTDGKEDIEWLCRKIVQLRIFGDAEGIPNLSVLDVQGGILVISQFTLHASTKKGNRPSYIRASKPEIAIPVYEAFVKQLSEDLGKPVATGIFGADMKVALVNDGPVTIIMDTKQKEF
jgi:D-tyrosyl-tRNA(Tyr) deacylase